MLKKLKILILFFLLSYISITHWANNINFWLDKIDNWLQWWGTNLVTTWTNILLYLIWLIYFVAIVYWLYGWFIILTSGWADDKVKKWKKIIIFVVVWLAVMFLASTIVNWVIDTMSSDQITWNTTN